MAVDWGEDQQPELAPPGRRRMMTRVLSYFRPSWRPGLLVVASIAVQAVLGLATAVVFKVTDRRPRPPLSGEESMP